MFVYVVKFTNIRALLDTITADDLYLEQMYVKTTCLHGVFHEKIYMM